jgi:integrase
VDEILGLYIADRTSEGKVAVPRMKQCREVLRPHFGALLPSQIDKQACRNYEQLRRNINVSDGTIRTELTYLSIALRFAVDMKLLSLAPRIWRPPQARPRSSVEDYHLSRPQAARLLGEAKQLPHLRLWITLALATAGRPLHILQLTWSRVDFRRGTINLDDPERDRTKKGRARVPMNDEARAALLEAKRRATTPYVIEWNGKPLKRIKGVLARAANRANVKASPYVLRHTAAVWMAEAGVPMEEIAQYLGHNDLSTTYKVYARFSPTHLKRAADALRVVRGSTGTNVPGSGNTERTEPPSGIPA